MRTALKNIAIVLGVSALLLCLSCSQSKPKPHLFQSETSIRKQSEFDYTFFDSGKEKKSPMEDFDPIGKDYNTIIDYFEQNGLTYMRSVSDLNNNCLFYFDRCDIDKSDSIFKTCYFDDANMCLRWKRSYLPQKLDMVVNWLDKNFVRQPNETMTWKDTRQKLTYYVYDEDILIELDCGAETYQHAPPQDDRLIINYMHVSFYDPDHKEWDDGGGDNNRFVIPMNDNYDINGDIIHFRSEGKMRTYTIVSEPEYVELRDNNVIQQVTVMDGNGNELIFILHMDCSSVTLIGYEQVVKFDQIAESVNDIIRPIRNEIDEMMNNK